MIRASPSTFSSGFVPYAQPTAPSLVADTWKCGEMVLSTANLTGPSEHAVSFRARFSVVPLAVFAAAVATDLAYWETSKIQWANFSAWLLAFGLALGGLHILLAAIARSATPPLRYFRFISSGINCACLSRVLTTLFIHATAGHRWSRAA